MPLYLYTMHRANMIMDEDAIALCLHNTKAYIFIDERPSHAFYCK